MIPTHVIYLIGMVEAVHNVCAIVILIGIVVITFLGLRYLIALAQDRLEEPEQKMLKKIIKLNIVLTLLATAVITVVPNKETATLMAITEYSSNTECLKVK